MVKLLEKFNVITIDKDKAFEFKIGLYGNDRHGSSRIKGIRGIKQLKYGETAQGTNFVDRDGDQ